MDSKFMDELLNNTKVATEALQNSLNTMGMMLGEVVKNVPESDKHKVDNLKNGIDRALNAAKNGDANAVNDIIKQFNQWQ